MRDVPFDRAIAERLTIAVSMLDFKSLYIELAADIDSRFSSGPDIVDRITNDVHCLLRDQISSLKDHDYSIEHETSVVENSVTIKFGSYEYEDTLEHLVKNCLKE